MENKLETDLASSPRNDESDGDVQDPVDQEEEDEYEEPEEKVIPNNNVQNILKKLQSSGALIKKPKQEYRCVTCDEGYTSWEVLENHLIQHVSLPSVVLDKLPSDDEDTPPSGDENWSDEEEDAPLPKPAASKATPKKLDVSQLMNLNIKKPTAQNKNSDAALSKLSGLGFTIKKNATPIKKEPEDSSNDLMNKLGKLGGIKLKLKSDGSSKNSFTVVNGLKDFKTSDDEDEDGEESGNEESRDDQEGENDEDQDKLVEQEESGADQDSADEETGNKSRTNSESDDANKINKKIANALKNLQGKSVHIKSETLKVPKTEPAQSPSKSVSQEVKQPKRPGRPAVKQTPKRGANLPIQKEFHATQATPTPPPTPPAVPERRESRDVNNVVVKQEVDNEDNRVTTNTTPLFSTQIKSERTSPPPINSTPTITSVKSEPDAHAVTNAEPLFSNQNTPSNTAPLLPVTKKETEDLTIIEINGDSGDDDDDCCVVSATPAPDIKPIIPKTETPASVYPPPAFPASTPSTQHTPSSFASTPMLSSRLSTAPSTEKQHNFNWNAPDSKPHLDILEKSTDEIFESLLSSATKKERDLALSDASEYISIDTLGPQHTCDVCNTRFTDMSLLEEHKRMTGHSMSLITPSASSSLLPYSHNQSSNILSSLLPVKQLAEQVGKLSGMGSGPGFTHQQNVMINIQAYPGAGGTMGPPQPYNAYPGASAYPQTPNNMYGATGQQMPGQYPGQHYMGQQGYGQYQQPMSKAGFPDNTYAPNTPYSAASPLQNMQQAYGPTSAGMMNTQAAMGQMGPPGSVPINQVGNQYAPASSPGGTMKPPSSSNVRIQNVQTFAPGQLVGAAGSEMAAPGQIVGGQMPSPSQIRMAPGATVTGTRPRMPSTVRGARPSIRPGIQVHGQVRGSKVGGPRMPLKRPGGMMNAQAQKQRRPDMLLPGKHDNEDCQVMAMQKQREGMPMIHSVQGAKDKLNLGSQISITKKTVNREANDMARALASRGISVKQKQKSRSPSPERPVPRIPNLGAGVSIKHANKSNNFSIPEAKVGGGMLSCKLCKKMFMNHNSLQVHMANAHPQSKIPMFKCDECPASYPKSLQLQHHKRVFHNVSGPNRELGLPVVDLSQEDNLKRLSSLGIYSFIPLANREQASGCFGIPVVSVHNGMSNNLQALGADGLLSLGPLKPLPNS
ncbi:uncharacterized protein LOC128679769 [Plodia interpunctella]|uniref:uncharacterized protein LOC128679769 n=1 Tax=Plodia interpunctella TaxID=58824 RepID=UPI00236775EB|nr:uncharacterized protein LOC128679769 [Plodia interpunctella]